MATKPDYTTGSGEKASTATVKDMAVRILRVNKTDNYTVISNAVLNDTRLSWDARGLMAYLLSKPDNWQVRMSDLERQGPAGNKKMRRILAELREHGYMNRVRVTLEHNKFDWITEIYEYPALNPEPSKAIKKKNKSKPVAGFAQVAQRTSAEGGDIVNTELQNTDSIDREREEEAVFEIFSYLQKLGYSPKEGDKLVIRAWLEYWVPGEIKDIIRKSRLAGGMSIAYIDTALESRRARPQETLTPDEVVAAYKASREQEAAEVPTTPEHAVTETVEDETGIVDISRLYGKEGDLIRAFLDETGRNLFVENEREWRRKFREMADNGFTPDDITQAVADTVKNNPALIDPNEWVDPDEILPALYDIPFPLYDRYERAEMKETSLSVNVVGVTPAPAEASEQPAPIISAQAAELAALERAKVHWEAKALKEQMQRTAAEKVGLPVGRWSAQIQGETPGEMEADARRLFEAREAQRSAPRENPISGRSTVDARA